MYETVKTTPVSMEQVGQSIVESAKGATGSILNMIKGILDGTVIPLCLAALMITMLFLIGSIAYEKRRGETDTLETKVKALLVSFAVFVVLAGYGVIWGNLIATLVGQAV